MIGIIDYGVGNVAAIATVYKRLCIPAILACDEPTLRSCERLILPGVGSFDWAMRRLNDSGLRPCLEDAVRGGTPVLGICVGMQMMAECSEEGELQGLGWIPGEVRKFTREEASPLRLPHMGWNDVRPLEETGLFSGLGDGARFYFLHSYYFAAHGSENVVAVTDYGCSFASSVRAASTYGVQFHPEKSHGWGMQLLKNFAEA